MENRYEAERRALLGQLQEIEQSPRIQKALDKRLANDGKKTDYDAWLESSAKFAKDNEILLKALMN